MALEVQHGSPESGRIWDSTARMWNALVMAVLVTSIGIAALTYGALTPYDYWAGKSVLDVRVHNGTAYSALSLGKNFYLALVVGAGSFAWGSFRLWKIWRGRRRPTT